MMAGDVAAGRLISSSLAAANAVSQIHLDMQLTSAGTDLSCPGNPSVGKRGHDKSVPAESPDYLFHQHQLSPHIFGAAAHSMQFG